MDVLQLMQTRDGPPTAFVAAFLSLWCFGIVMMLGQVTMAIIALLNGVNTWYREGGRLTHLQVSDIHWDMVRRAFALPGAT